LSVQVDSHVEIAPIVDSVIKKGKSEKGPSLGEYFLYAALNRMIDTTSKRALPDWYRATAVQQIRPVDVDELTSERYFEKWDRVKEEDLQKIATLFSSKIVKLEKSKSGCFLFDTTNYYTYMANQTDSDLGFLGVLGGRTKQDALFTRV
jgi:hypothetical protein